MLFMGFQLLTAISFFLMSFIPTIPQSASVEFHCDNGASDILFCPKNNQLDRCVEHKLETHFANKSVSCLLNCETEPWMWDVVCNHWGIINCNENQKNHLNTNLVFPIYLKMDQIETMGNCLYFLVHGKALDGKNSTIYCPSSSNSTYFKANCDITCGDAYIRDTLAEAKIENRDVFGLHQFWLFFMLLVISWVGMAVVVSVGDAICFEMLGERHYLYGNQRLWGAVGWGFFSILSGILIDKLSGGSVIKDYTIVFYMALVIITLDMLVSIKLEHHQTKLSTNILKDIGTIFLSIRVTIFFLWCICVGLCTALIWNFLFWHLEELRSVERVCDNQDSMKTLQGLAMGIQCFGGELPFFFLSGWILKKIGHINAMSLVLFGFGVRFILYYLLTNPWWVLPIELMNGITFGIFYSTMASYASIVAPPGTEATLQGLVGAIFEGVGVSLGSFIGGILFKTVGGSYTFFLFGITALCAFFIHALVQWLLQKYGQNIGKHAIYNPGNGDISNKSTNYTDNNKKDELEIQNF